MKRLALLRQLHFGAQVAEDEVQELVNYFVQTHQWDQIANGALDIIRGEKGAGKSAIYSLLISRADEFFDRGILFVAAETPRGATVFKDLVADPPTTEQEFIWLWKIYILVIIAQKLREFHVIGTSAQKLYGALEEARLLQPGNDLSGLLRRAQHFVRGLMRAEVAGGIEVDPFTGTPTGITTKLTLREPIHTRPDGYHSVDALFKLADSALSTHNYKIWVLLDRLDVAFSESHDLEANALRALLRIYGDLKALDSINLKIFLREDIWKRIFQTGFREASHINRYAVLEWSAESLLNLVVRRLLNNQVLLKEFSIDRERVLQSSELQVDLFKRLFPDQVEQGERRPETFKWMVSRCADASGKTAPRELIHLLKAVREAEIARLEKGGTPASDDQLFDRSVFKEALRPVSVTRLHQYLYAEYPDFRPLLSRLEHAKTEHTPESLAVIWEMDEKKAEETAEQLREIGFFERRGSREKPTYWVPFLYRNALELVQGKADED